MAVDQSLVGRVFPPTEPYTVTPEGLRAFAEATGAEHHDGRHAPATFPVVVTFQAMNDFLATESIELSRIVHGDQKFAYERPVVVGDVLTATLTVTGLRQIGGNDIISTSSEITDADGALVCASSATLVHRAAA